MSRRNIAVLMITVSDNTATNLCIDWGRHRGNQRAFARTRNRVYDPAAQDAGSVREGGENLITPQDLVKMLQALYTSKPTSSVAEGVLDICARWKKSPRTQPARGRADLVETRWYGSLPYDAGIVWLPRRPYAIAVMSKYGLGDHTVQEGFISDTARRARLYVCPGLDAHGQGVPPEFLEV